MTETLALRRTSPRLESKSQLRPSPVLMLPTLAAAVGRRQMEMVLTELRVEPPAWRSSLA
jgi:hypothetical protein